MIFKGMKYSDGVISHVLDKINSLNSAARWLPDSAPCTNFHRSHSGYSSPHLHSVPESLQNNTTPCDTQHHCPTTYDHPMYPVNDHRSESCTEGPKAVCEWNDDNGICGKNINLHRDSIKEHMASYHLKSRLRGAHPVKCRWKDCQYTKDLRGDTIIRHITATHFRIKRPKSGRVRVMAP